MRLPQDRILHIGTELKDGKVNIVAEWQGELVLCKDCENCLHYDDETESGFLWCTVNTRPTTQEDFCSFAERREP